MIPVFGSGTRPAIVAIFIYGFLPIVRNAHAGLTGILPGLRESEILLGLSPLARQLKIELPLASPSILAGIITAGVINFGNATIGALNDRARLWCWSPRLGFAGTGVRGEGIGFLSSTIGHGHLIGAGGCPIYSAPTWAPFSATDRFISSTMNASPTARTPNKRKTSK